MTRQIAFVVHPGFQLLDVAGPVAAFEIAGRFVPDSYGCRREVARLKALPA